MLTTMNMTRSDALDLLGIAGDYDWVRLRKAYAKQAFAWHPDVSWVRGVDFATANYRMALVNRAYEMLRSELFYMELAGDPA